MPKDIHVQRQAEDRAMILNEDAWPHWPVLPIKRLTPNKQRELAFINALGQYPPKYEVIFENIFRFTGMTNEQRRACRMEIYDSIDAMLEDGWTVD